MLKHAGVQSADSSWFYAKNAVNALLTRDSGSKRLQILSESIRIKYLFLFQCCKQRANERFQLQNAAHDKFSSDMQQIARKTAPDPRLKNRKKQKCKQISKKDIAPSRNCMEVSPTFLQGECCAWHMPWHGPQDHDAWVDSGLQPCLAIWLCSTTLSTTSVWC